MTRGRNTSDTSSASTEAFVGPWILLFPATYLAHIAEEQWGGFTARAAELTGFAIPEAAFLAANGFFWVLMSIAMALVLRRPSRAPLVVAVATVVAINAALHVGSSLLWAGYSPGLLTAVLLWLPLGVAALMRGYRLLPERSFRFGVLVGVVAHVLVPVVGFGFVLALGGAVAWR
ncbi:MAG: HXXEE domain-containing protein [Deltaproteobacteria bacterium]|nr:HXXEE domain-containing protein [Deltaproteobacteria bacterium]